MSVGCRERRFHNLSEKGLGKTGFYGEGFVVGTGQTLKG